MQSICIKELRFCHKLNFLISISLQRDGENRWFFKLRLFDLTEFIVWNIKGLRYGGKQLEFVATTHFLYKFFVMQRLKLLFGVIPCRYVLGLSFIIRSNDSKSFFFFFKNDTFLFLWTICMPFVHRLLFLNSKRNLRSQNILFILKNAAMSLLKATQILI